jgi:hypothetical protein
MVISDYSEARGKFLYALEVRNVVNAERAKHQTLHAGTGNSVRF